MACYRDRFTFPPTPIHYLRLNLCFTGLRWCKSMFRYSCHPWPQILHSWWGNGFTCTQHIILESILELWCRVETHQPLSGHADVQANFTILHVLRGLHICFGIPCACPSRHQSIIQRQQWLWGSGRGLFQIPNRNSQLSKLKNNFL
jgi:hypothetical protein